MTQQEITLRILEGALDLIRDYEHWTDGPMARDAQSHPVNADDPAACQWCAWGAQLSIVRRLKGELDEEVVEDAYSKSDGLLCAAAEELYGRYSFLEINEGNLREGTPLRDCHAAIVNIYKQAILWAREEAAGS